MLSTSSIFGVISCGFVLCVGLSDANAEGNGVLSEGDSGPTVIQEDQTGLGPGDEVIKGEVLRVEGDHLFVKAENGKEVRMQIDQTTGKNHKIPVKGELIEATVNGEGHALSINSPDRKNEHTLDPAQTMEPLRK